MSPLASPFWRSTDMPQYFSTLLRHDALLVSLGLVFSAALKQGEAHAFIRDRRNTELFSLQQF
jgi:hypothetical protein